MGNNTIQNILFGNYYDLFNCQDVDVIYIATPHTSHKEWSIKAMNHGKHVLCEKPMGMKRSDVVEMISVAKKNRVFLMEALWSRFNPTLKKVKELVEIGEIGELVMCMPTLPSMLWIVRRKVEY